MRSSTRNHPNRALLAVLLCALAVPTWASDTSGVGVTIRSEATAQDLGLPIYPGAVPRKDREDDKGALTLAAWGGDALFKVAVLKLTSDAPMERVARFYRDALGRFGPVLDCSKAEPSASDRDDVLTCDKKDVRGNALVYKVGVPKHLHLVKLKDQGDRVQIDLVSVDAGA